MISENRSGGGSERTLSTTPSNRNAPTCHKTHTQISKQVSAPAKTHGSCSKHINNVSKTTQRNGFETLTASQLGSFTRFFSCKKKNSCESLSRHENIVKPEDAFQKPPKRPSKNVSPHPPNRPSMVPSKLPESASKHTTYRVQINTLHFPYRCLQPKTHGAECHWR